ncbi:hypothetical protein [Streptomyces sp. NPDC005407]|uniref:hypothetical protein n=1 Tax=Streptomyces sp. NPDC005407 TaxID=3155340 RepID=UPI0033A702CE
MTSLNRPARLNRTLLAVFDVLLLGSGSFALAGHFGQLTFLDSGATLIPTTADPPTWALWVTAAAAVTVGLLILRWLVAQLSRRPKTHTWHLEQNPEQGPYRTGRENCHSPLPG